MRGDEWWAANGEIDVHVTALTPGSTAYGISTMGATMHTGISDIRKVSGSRAKHFSVRFRTTLVRHVEIGGKWLIYST